MVPNSIASVYPYNESGSFVSSVAGEYMEQLTTISYIAGITSKIKLLTSVMVLPHRSPVLTAKILSTIDVLSNGRLIVGCGVGWMKEEFEAIGAPPYEERGAVGSEYLRVFKELWTNDDPTFDGDYASFSDIAFAPKPVQKPHPPIWIGGRVLLRSGARGNSATHGIRYAATRSSRWARLSSWRTTRDGCEVTRRTRDATRPRWISRTA